MVDLIDSSVRNLIIDQLGSDEAKPVLLAIEKQLAANNVVSAPALMGSGKTKGDWRITLYNPNGSKREDVRPDSAVNYAIIREMLKNGSVQFAVNMKIARMISNLRNKRSINVVSTNEELAKVTETVVETVLPFMAYEFAWSSLVYGSAFMETVWESKSLKQLGLEGDKIYTVPKQCNLVPHHTVRHIVRTSEGEFAGFVQMSDWRVSQTIAADGTIGPGDILVPAKDSLVIPYRGFSRNLWGESFLAPIYPLWFWLETVLRSLVSFSNLMGDPPRIGKAPSKKKVRLSNSAELVDAIDYLLALAVNMNTSNAVILPSDRDESGNEEWSLGYMQAPDRSQPFVQIVDLFNRLILRAAMTGDQQYSATANSAIGELNQEATALHDESVVTTWVHYLNRYWISHISEYNLGVDGEPVWLEVQGLDPREREFFKSVAGIAGNSSTFQEFFYQVNWRDFGIMAGLPMLTESEKDALKEKMAQQEAQKTADNMRQQQDINAEGTVKQAKAQKEANKVLPPAETDPRFQKQQPTKAEVYDSTWRLANSDRLPIFLTETQYDRIMLYNKYHDALGRFTSGQAAASNIVARTTAKAAGAIGEWAKSDQARAVANAVASTSVSIAGPLSPTGMAINAAAGILNRRAKELERKMEEEKYLKAQQEYQEIYDKMPFAEKVLATPAEYIARKQGMMPQLARMGLDMAPEIAMRYTIGAGIYSAAAWAGGAAVAAASVALFGSVPTMAVVIGGLVAGTATMMVVNHGLDFAGDAAVRAYLGKYSPKDEYHMDFSHMSNTKKAWKATSIAWDVWTSSEHLVLGVAYDAFAPHLGLPTYSSGTVDMLREVANNANGLEVALEEGEPGDIHEFVVSLMPYVAAMAVGQIFQIKIPFDNQLQHIPGFMPIDNALVMIPDTLPEFVEAYATGKMPEIKSIQFGELPEISVDPTKLEADENVRLYNKNHDDMGRFSSGQGGGASSGSSESKGKAAHLWGDGNDYGVTDAQVSSSEKEAKAIVDKTGKMFKSGLVDNLEVSSCGNDKCVMDKLGEAGNFLGAYALGQLVITPMGVSYSGNKDYYNRIVSHETTHARKRSQGGTIGRMDDLQSGIEEGCTELISMGATRYPHKYSPYHNQMASVATAARKQSGNDRAKAWEIVNAMHYYNDTSKSVGMYKSMGGSVLFTNGDSNDIDWLFEDVPTRLEKDQDVEALEKVFAASEKEIYSKLRKKVKAKKVAAKPLTDEELKLELIQLFNQNHDNLGRFSSASRAAVVVSAVVGVGGIISAKIAEVKVENLAKKIKRQEGVDTATAKRKAYNTKVFSTTINGKEVSVSYGEWHKGSAKVAQVAFWAATASYIAWNIAELSKAASYVKGGGGKNYNKYEKRWREKQYESFRQAQKPAWPPEANDADFQKMYRKVAKKYHPDLGGDTATMQKINNLYSKKDWNAMKAMFDASGFTLEEGVDEKQDVAALFIRTLYEAIKAGNSFIRFECGPDDEELPPFVIVEDEGKKYMVLDKFTAALIVGLVMDNYDELDEYLTQESNDRAN